jgi:hypothetical protein
MRQGLARPRGCLARPGRRRRRPGPGAGTGTDTDTGRATHGISLASNRAPRICLISVMLQPCSLWAALMALQIWHPAYSALLLLLLLPADYMRAACSHWWAAGLFENCGEARLTADWMELRPRCPSPSEGAAAAMLAGFTGLAPGAPPAVTPLCIPTPTLPLPCDRAGGERGGAMSGCCACYDAGRRGGGSPSTGSAVCTRRWHADGGK